MTPLLRIGEASARAGVNIQTLRYYERRGLIKAPERGSSGYREYTPETVQLVKLIKRAQKFGFSLNEIKHLLDLCENNKANCGKLHDAISSKIADTNEQLAALNGIQQSLKSLVDSCSSNGPLDRCPIMKSLND
ncbi:MAG: heavy metal-responsive transcriptional regulator [Candidatus Obscuribacterales bacterium]|nr:heavy metal-responsive transcriptional regulator [Candidatus Obscuribacterales bacterium]